MRTDKVAAIQAALAAGTYNVPASAVASKLVDAMLGGAVTAAWAIADMAPMTERRNGAWSGKSERCVSERNGRMHDAGATAANPELKELVVEASRALARLDAARLEELALSLPGAESGSGRRWTRTSSRQLARQAREAAGGYGGVRAGAGSDAGQSEGDEAAARAARGTGLEYSEGGRQRGVRERQRRRAERMGTINSAFSLMAGALDADQAALNVVANNVANANTPGYTEETPTGRRTRRSMSTEYLIGDGVTETGATSQRDRVLEERLDQQQQLASASSTRLTALNTMQALFTPDSGSSSSTAGDIGSDITSFFDSFSSLESRSDRQRAARAGAFLGVDAGRRHLERGEQPERAERGARPGSAGRGQPGELADQRHCAAEPADPVHFARTPMRARSKTSGSRT